MRFHTFMQKQSRIVFPVDNKIFLDALDLFSIEDFREML